MVQVDVFWSYAIGAGFAASASRQIQSQEQAGKFEMLENRAFARTLIFLGALFAPSGICLLWAFPGWETMYVARSWEDLPAWLVAAFAITNVTQGILGFWVTSRLIRQNRLYAANLQWVLGYFLMLFILVHGWDGTGYRRFFTRTVAEWQAGSEEFWGNLVLKWLTCPVALTLYAMGVIMLPLMFYWMALGVRSGFGSSTAEHQQAAAAQRRMLGLMLRIILVEVLGVVIVAHLLISYAGMLLGSAALGWIVGLLAWAVLLYFLGLRRGGFLHRDLDKLTFEFALAHS